MNEGSKETGNRKEAGSPEDGTLDEDGTPGSEETSGSTYKLVNPLGDDDLVGSRKSSDQDPDLWEKVNPRGLSLDGGTFSAIEKVSGL
jgi:hypothetical protein